MSTMKVKARQYSVMFYEEHPDNYVASFQLYAEGNLGIIYTLNGRDFMRHIITHIGPLYSKCEVEVIMFSMLSPLLRRLKSVLKDHCDFDLMYTYVQDGRAFSMVQMRLKPST